MSIAADQQQTPVAVDPSTITFVGVGCERCGTTWIDAALREHPQVFLPPQKQTYFFDRNHDRGIDWYLENFRGVRPEHRAVGEVATGYCLVQAAPRLARHLPHVRLVMIVRDPVDRAFSNFQVRRHERGWGSFEEALEREPDLLDRGRYIQQIEVLLQHFDRDRLLLLFYEDLERDDRAFLRSILGFLGVEKSFESSMYGQTKNAAMFPRLRRALHAAGLKPALVAASRSPVGDLLRRARRRSGRRGYGPLDPQARRRLIEHFRPYNDRLAEFAGRDLAKWNNGSD